MKTRLNFALLAACGTLLPVAVSAHTSSENVSLEQGSDKNTLVITASRFKENTNPLSAGLTVISRAEIEATAASDVKSVLQRLAGVQISEVAGKAVIALRGISAEQASNNVLIQIDGRRLNHSDIAAVNLEQIDLEQVERIEIIQGGVSSLHGDQAVAGVINIITNGLSKKSSVHLSAGNFGSQKLGFQYYGAFNENWNFDAAFNWKKSDQYREHNELNSKNYRLGLDYLTSEGQWRLEIGRLNEELNTPGALLATDLSGASANPRQSRPEFKNDYVNTQQDYIRFNGEQVLSQTEASEWVFALDVNKTDADIDSINSFIGFATTNINHTDRDSLSVYPRIKASWDSAYGEIVWVSGLDYDKSNYEFDLLARSNSQTASSLYTQIYWPLSPALRVQAGARLAKVEDDLTDRALYPNGVGLDNKARAFDLGFDYKTENTGDFYARFSNNYRFAKVDEQSYTSPNVLGLEPQTGRSIELGWKQTWHDHRLKFEIYQLNFDDEIFFDSNAPKPVGAYFNGANVNGASSKRKGSTLDYRFELTQDFSAGANYHYVDAKLDGAGDLNIPGVSKNTGNIWFDWSFVEHTHWYFEYHRRSSRVQEGDLTNSFPKIEGYELFNTAVRWKNDDVSLSLRVDNLLNKNYIGYAQYNGFYPEGGRRFVASFKYQF